MSAVQWFSGPPPAVGWWPASDGEYLNAYRWWNGKAWGSYASNLDSKSEAELAAYAVHPVRIKFVSWRHWSIEIDGTDGRGAHE